jgi:CRISPR/Cas system-associated exonuclease Cas4 (RecB family)
MVVRSSSARTRLRAARAFVNQFRPDAEILIVAATRGAADDFARDIARARATFGLHRFGLTELAARAAAIRLTAAGRLPATSANAEAIAARATFDAVRDEELTYFGPVAAMPGFPRALARTIYELRLASVDRSALDRRPAATGQGAKTDLARLLDRIADLLETASIEDRASLFDAASAAWQAGVRWTGCPVLFLDVPLASEAERRLALTVCDASSATLVTIAAGDEGTADAFAARGITIEELEDDAAPESDLGRLRRHIFTVEPPPERTRTGDVRLLSAPGEAREAVEIARRALGEAARGVRFDEMAVCLRAPQQYLGLLEHAFERGGIPAYFDRGTRRPDPSGRAFIALLSCACEKLSAKRFDEYLSLGEVPLLASPHQPGIVSPDDDVFASLQPPADIEDDESDDTTPAALDSDADAIVAGALRAPWKWEELIVESAVIGGVDRADGKRRWRRRLDGLAKEYALRIAELMREDQDPDSPRVARLVREARNLAHLRGFALPLVDTLGDWPAAATWGEWLDRFDGLAPRVLRRPDRVQRVLADLRPMASVGPVPLDEARDLLQERLLLLEWDPPPQRYGRVFVGTPHQIRGRAFRVVFVPGLAERVFPQRVREDPLFPDAERRATSDRLTTRSDRTSAERLLLRLAIGAATDRVCLSYPRLGAEMGDMRPRVPSFYALDVVRAMTGRVPDHRVLASEAADEADASLAWPAPRDPAHAIDDLEHDLAVLAPMLAHGVRLKDVAGGGDAGAFKGHARYLIELNDALRRSVQNRYKRSHERWSTSDGPIRVTPEIEPALTKNRLRNRPYSLSALQRFAACPYQFLLAAVHRIQVWEEPEPLVRMDPLTRGSVFHRAQAEFFRAMKTAGALPITSANIAFAIGTLREVVDRVAAASADELAPAIERVWRDEVADLRRDLGIWVNRMVDKTDWVPEYFEFSFGLHDEGRDPHSLTDPIVLDSGFILRGSVDLIERRADGSALRVTDHKTGKYRANQDLIIGGGSVLQPVLYSVAIERGLDARVASGRLYYCTTAGGFRDHEIQISDYARAQGLLALTIVDRAIELGHLPAAPAKDACRWCDFRPICGPDEEQRVSKKPAALIADLHALREVR